MVSEFQESNGIRKQSIQQRAMKAKESKHLLEVKQIRTKNEIPFVKEILKPEDLATDES